MVVVSKFKLLKQGALLALALLFLSTTMATHKHLVHTGLVKLITVDHQIRRDLARAERENLKTSVVSGRAEIVLNPLQEAAGIPRFPEFVLNAHGIPRPLIQFEPKIFVLDLSPVLNL